MASPYGCLRRRGRAGAGGGSTAAHGQGRGARAPKPAAPAADVGPLRTALAGTDGPAAREAARKLGELRTPAALDALLDALALGLHPRVAADALDAVAAHRSTRAVDVLLYYARHRDARVRARAVAALGGLDDPKAVAGWRAALGDHQAEVRAAAAAVAAQRKDGAAVKALVALLRKGDAPASEALAAVATAEVARQVAELIGGAPDALIADCLGRMLLRPDLGKEDLYVELVRAVGKLPGDEAVVALATFIGSLPDNSPRQSRREAQAIYEARLGGGQ